MPMNLIEDTLDDFPVTWERLIPNRMANDAASRKIVKLHLKRYDTATKYVKGKKVLDIACGTGYGSQMLCRAGASKVTGVDISLQTIEYARRHYQMSQIEFICAEAEQFECLQPFDVVVSFETLEHVKNPTQFLQRIHNFLAADGLFILSVPLGETRHFDPYHLHAFTQEQVFALLEKTGFSINSYHCEQCFFTRRELLGWKQLYPESSPSYGELLFTKRGWHILRDLFIQGGFDAPQLLVTTYKR